ncbi:MAG: hypothetical protein KDC76_07945, partial [Bacteroidetes bacterium]|nr:hypothetical protein [Bacteroidota bacterium]
MATIAPLRLSKKAPANQEISLKNSTLTIPLTSFLIPILQIHITRHTPAAPSELHNSILQYHGVV